MEELSLRTWLIFLILLFFQRCDLQPISKIYSVTNAKTNKSYYPVRANRKLNFFEVQDLCQANNAFLAEPRDKDDCDYVFRSKQKYFVGLVKDTNKNVWYYLSDILTQKVSYKLDRSKVNSSIFACNCGKSKRWESGAIKFRTVFCEQNKKSSISNTNTCVNTRGLKGVCDFSGSSSCPKDILTTSRGVKENSTISPGKKENSTISPGKKENSTISPGIKENSTISPGQKEVTNLLWFILIPCLITMLGIAIFKRESIATTIRECFGCRPKKRCSGTKTSSSKSENNENLDNLVAFAADEKEADQCLSLKDSDITSLSSIKTEQNITTASKQRWLKKISLVGSSVDIAPRPGPDAGSSGSSNQNTAVGSWF